MWREAFQSVADDVDRISREVSEKVADDPLASIGMAATPAPREKSVATSSLVTKRRRKEEQDKEAATAAALDPFARRKTRPKSYWAVGNELQPSKDVRIFLCGGQWYERLAAVLICGATSFFYFRSK